MKRSTFLPVPQVYNLSFACEALADAWGCHVYLVGSSLERRDYRDVDVRMILPDDEFDRLFPGIEKPYNLDARWGLLCCALSLWLKERSDLPIDFQFQRQSEANEKYPNEKRNALGIWRARVDKPRDEERRLAP